MDMLNSLRAVIDGYDESDYVLIDGCLGSDFGENFGFRRQRIPLPINSPTVSLLSPLKRIQGRAASPLERMHEI